MQTILERNQAELARAICDVTWREFTGDPDPARLAAGFNTILLVIRQRHVCGSAIDIMNAINFKEAANLYYRRHNFDVQKTIAWMDEQLPNTGNDRPFQELGFGLLQWLFLILIGIMLLVAIMHKAIEH